MVAVPAAGSTPAVAFSAVQGVSLSDQHVVDDLALRPLAQTVGGSVSVSEGGVSEA